MGAHNSIGRYLYRVDEEIRSAAEIAKLTSWPAAMETLIAKADIQIMCRNRYAESPNARRRLIRKYEALLKCFEKQYGDFASGYRYKVNLPAVPEELKGCIWLCWWQGLGRAPRIIQRCVESIREYAGDRRVIVITENNYRDYVIFPDWMMRKYHEGTVARTRLSDLLCLSLLTQYDGLWLDATFYRAGDIENYFDQPLFSVKRPEYLYASVVQGYFANYSSGRDADCRWIFAVTRDFLFEYWRTNDFMVDYLFLDYLVVLVQRHCTTIKKAFAVIIPNSPQCDDLFKCLGDAFNERHWESLIADTSLFKLTRKQESPTETNGAETYYGRLLNGNLRRN